MEEKQVLWITGLSGAGKTSVAKDLQVRCRQAGIAAILLDGDSLRAILGDRFGHTPDDRLYLAMCYGRLCQELSHQGFTVICATISMFETVRAWNREHIPGYREIYLRVPEEERHRRDIDKGVYRGATAPVPLGRDGFDEPRNSDLVIDNHGSVSAHQAVDVIWATFFGNGKP